MEWKNTGGVYRLEESIDGTPVTVIGKKEFLGCRDLRQIDLPKSVVRVEDWAFAHAKALEKVTFASPEVSFGKEVFAGCDSLQCVSFGDENRGRLLAMMLRLGRGKELLDAQLIQGKEWQDALDKEIRDYLSEEDAKGYEGLWTFGEEDYDEKSFDEEQFCNERRMKKTELVFLRLLYGESAPEDFERYLRERTSGCGREDAFLCIVKNHARDIRYFEVMKKAGGITKENRQKFLECAEDSTAEIRAFLLASQDGQNDFFQGLFL